MEWGHDGSFRICRVLWVVGCHVSAALNPLLEALLTLSARLAIIAAYGLTIQTGVSVAGKSRLLEVALKLTGGSPQLDWTNVEFDSTPRVLQIEEGRLGYFIWPMLAGPQ